MADTASEAAIPHLPYYMTVPGETDVLFVIVVIFVVLLVLALGTFYFHMHALPERMAHSSGKVQFQLVAILALLALFTHNNIFWIIALLLATIEFPDYGTTFSSIEQSLRKIANRAVPFRSEPSADDVSEPPLDEEPDIPAEQKG